MHETKDKSAAKAAGSLAKRGRPPTETTLPSSFSRLSSQPISFHLVPVNPTISSISSNINTNGKPVKRLRRLAKRRFPPTSMTKVFKMSDPAIAAHHHVSSGTGKASTSTPLFFNGRSSTQAAGARAIIQHDIRASSSSSSNDGDDDDDDLLLKHLCLALSNSTNQDRINIKDDSPSSSFTYRSNRNRRRRSSTTSITSTINDSSSRGGQFGFLALGPLSPSSPRNRSSSRTAATTPRATVIEATEAEEEAEEENGRMEDEGLVSIATTTTSAIPSPRYGPTLEELETMVYSNPLDFEPEEFVPLQLGEEDFLPIFEDISCTDDWQQQQRQQQQGGLPIPFMSELPFPTLRLPPSLSLSTLLSSSSSGIDFDMDGFWDAQPSQARRYNCSSAMTTGPGAPGTTNESYFAILSAPPLSASCSFEYDAVGHVALLQAMQQQHPLPNPVLAISSNLNPNLNDLAVQFSSSLGATVEIEMASAPTHVPTVSMPVPARNTKHYIDLVAAMNPASLSLEPERGVFVWV
ncbi:MAG: hypothetical protein J3R72DRAFT_428057 [Linnemannia gamsii]|nr:MAG: hypothetical protein J3R72DRAFT_428057 [Linnemannia gamsii]